MYRNIQTFAVKMLQECNFWAFRTFLTPNRNMFGGRFVRFFKRNYCKISDHFG